MYIGIMKFSLEDDTYDVQTFRKDAKHHCERLRKKFPVIARGSFDQSAFFAISILAEKATSINQVFDDVLAATEERGFGRILDEDRVVASLNDVFLDDGAGDDDDSSHADKKSPRSGLRSS